MNRCLSVIFVMILAVTGCARRPAAPASESKHSTPSAPVVHTITKQGETLGSISKRYTGSAANWSRILEHNPELNPLRLKKGQTVKIPAELLVRSEIPAKKKSNRNQAAARGSAPVPSSPNSAEVPASVKKAPSDMADNSFALESEELRDRFQEAILHNSRR